MLMTVAVINNAVNDGNIGGLLPLVNHIRCAFDVREMTRPREGTIYGPDIWNRVREACALSCVECTRPASCGANGDALTTPSCADPTRPMAKYLVETMFKSSTRTEYFFQALLFGHHSVDNILFFRAGGGQGKMVLDSCGSPHTNKIARAENIDTVEIGRTFLPAIYLNNMAVVFLKLLRNGESLLLKFKDQRLAIPVQVAWHSAVRQFGHIFYLMLHYTRTHPFVKVPCK